MHLHTVHPQTSRERSSIYFFAPLQLAWGLFCNEVKANRSVLVSPATSVSLLLYAAIAIRSKMGLIQDALIFWVGHLLLTLAQYFQGAVEEKELTLVNNYDKTPLIFASFRKTNGAEQ